MGSRHNHNYRRSLLLFGTLGLVAVAPFLPYAKGYAGGAPPSAKICESMIPGHGETPQAGRGPYSVRVSKLNPKGGEVVDVTLTAPAGESFKGFLVAVKPSSNNKTTVGRFDPRSAPQLAQGLSCFESSQSAMTHTSSQAKNSVTLKWIAPNDDHPDLQLYYTFVKDGSTYWTHIPHAEKLTVVKDPNFTTESPVSGGISDSLRRKITEAYDSCSSGAFGCMELPDGCINSFLANKNETNPKLCKLMARWEARGEKNVYTLIGKPTEDADPFQGYIALGLSSDAKMGSDSVVGCFKRAGQPDVKRTYNRGTSNQAVDQNGGRLGLENTALNVEDGVWFCTFEQTDHDHQDANIKMRDGRYHYLLSRSGSMSQSALGQHGSNDKVASASAIHITDTGIVGTKDSSRLLYQLHGAIMILAWLVCASTGMFTARYFKLTHTTFMPFNKAFWFVLHLTCMFSTAFLTAAGAVIIIVKKSGFSFKQAEKISWHPVLGVILFGLAIFQVLIAFFRPHPGTSRRPIFNWVHWIVGNSAHIIGIVCIFLATELSAAGLEKKETKDAYSFIWMGAVLFHIVMHLILSFQTLWADKQMDVKSKRAVVPGPLKSNGLNSEAPGSGFRTFMLILYVLGLLGCAVALIYFVFKPEEEKSLDA